MLVLKGLRLALKGVPSTILAYFVKHTLGLRTVFSSSFFAQCPLRIELIWFNLPNIEK